MTYSYRMGKKVLTGSQTEYTNDLGKYRIHGLSPGRHYINASVKSIGFENEMDRSTVPASNPK